MTSTYTPNLGIEKPATGDQSGTWSDTNNTNFDLIDEAICGQAAITLTSSHITSGGAYALTITDGASSEGRNAFIDVTDGGDITDNGYVQFTPNDSEKLIWIRNSLSASRSLFVFQGTYDGGRDYEIPNGYTALMRFTGGGASASYAYNLVTGLKIDTSTATTDYEGTVELATQAEVNTGTDTSRVLTPETFANSSRMKWTRSLTVESPTAAEDVSWFFTNKALTVTEIRVVLVGSSSPSLTWIIRYGSDRSASGTTMHTKTTTSTTNGDDITSITSATIPADNFIWLETTAESGSVDSIHFTLWGDID